MFIICFFLNLFSNNKINISYLIFMGIKKINIFEYILFLENKVLIIIGIG